MIHDVISAGCVSTLNEIYYCFLIAEKKNESYADVINYIRTRLRFSLLKSVLMAILRGVNRYKHRGKREATPAPISIEFYLIEQ